MATKKATKKPATRKPFLPKVPQVTMVELSPNQFMDFLRQNRGEDVAPGNHPMHLTPASHPLKALEPASTSKPSALGDMVFSMRDYADNLANYAAELRARLYCHPTGSEPKNQATSPSQGALKDNVSAAHSFMMQIQSDLFAINEYINS